MSSNIVWLFVLLCVIIVIAISGFLFTISKNERVNKLNLQEKSLKERTNDLEKRAKNIDIDKDFSDK
jgi:Tfp pilus assembly protein PilO